MNINKTFRSKSADNFSPVTRLHWAIGLHRDAKIVTADSGGMTWIGVKFPDGHTDFYVECTKDEIGPVIQGARKLQGKKIDLLNFKSAKNALSLETIKVVVTKLNPESNVLRLYWRIPYPDAPGGYVDWFWTDVGRDGGIGPLSELWELLLRNKIRMSDVIRKDL